MIDPIAFATSRASHDSLTARLDHQHLTHGFLRTVIMKFYDCSTAPSARLVRMFIAEKGIEIPTIEVDLQNSAHLTDEFRAINPHCTVPVLEIESGQRFTSTQGCWRYLEEKFPKPTLLGKTTGEKVIIADRVWRIDVDGFLAVAEGLRNKSAGLKDRALTGPVNYAQIPELSQRGIARTTHFLATIEDMLGDNEFIAGDTFSAADIIAFVTVEFAKWIKLSLPEEAKNARLWYQRVSDRPSASLELRQ